MSKLLIIESVGKVKKLNDILNGSNRTYIIKPCFGHIMDLDNETMSIDLENYEPEYTSTEFQKNTIQQLLTIVKAVGEQNVIIASDNDREGEMIGFSIMTKLKLNKPKRIIFTSITPKAITDAIRNPSTIDNNMVEAQIVRRLIDRITGYFISPIISKLTSCKSAGRVQSVITKIIVDKENEIKTFFNGNNESYFYITSDVKIKSHKINMKLCDNQPEKQSKKQTDKDKNINTNENDNDSDDDTENTIKGKKIFNKKDEEKMTKTMSKMSKSTYKIDNITNKIIKSNPAPPFTTSSMQQYASTNLHISSKETMIIAEKLYQSGLITYMRTDSTMIAEDAIPSIKKIITEKYGEPYFEHKNYESNNENGQNGHECIRPSSCETEEIEGSIKEQKLYHSIWKRTIQSQMKSAEYQNITININFDGHKLLDTLYLTGNLNNLIYVGYLIVDNKKPNDDINYETLKQITPSWITINGIENTLKPPIRYTESLLLKKIDVNHLNIARPSTTATIIDKILGKNKENKIIFPNVKIENFEGKKITVKTFTINNKTPKIINVDSKELYIGKEINKFTPTELGYKTTEFLNIYFPKIMDYEFTKKMEKDLDKIAIGKITRLEIIKPFGEYIYEQIIKIIKMNNTIYTIDLKTIPNIKLLNEYFENLRQNYGNKFNNLYGEINGTPVYLINSTNGKFIACGNSTLSITNNDENDKKEELLNQLKNKINSSKEWKINSKTYILKKGQFGHYILEKTTNNKKGKNYSIEFLIKKISYDNKLDIDEDIDKITDKITVDMISEQINFYKNKK